MGVPWPRIGLSRDPIFIIGSGRSGTTLLRRMLMAADAVHIPPETHVLGSVCRRHTVIRWLPWRRYVDKMLGRFAANPNFEYWYVSRDAVADELAVIDDRSLAGLIASLYRYHMRLNWGRSDMRWGDKSPLNTWNLPELDRVFPEALYIETVRDGVDVASSLVRAGICGDVEGAMARWVSAVEQVDAFRAAAADRIVTVRYEDLAADPYGEVRRLGAFLGQPELRYVEGLPAADLGDWTRPHLSRVQEPVDGSSVGRGRDEIDERVLARLSAMADPTLVRLGYEPVV